MKMWMSEIHQRLSQPSSNFMCVRHRPGIHPIISAQHILSGIDIHIDATAPKHGQHESTRRFLAAYPHLKPLYFVVRAALHTRSLLDGFHGGLGSYGTLILVLASVARLTAASTSSSSVSSPSPAPSLGAHLREFLSFYASLDPCRHGLSVVPRAKKFLQHPDTNPATISVLASAAKRRGDPVRAQQWHVAAVGEHNPRLLQPYLLALQDPADPANDLGRRAHAVKHILASIGDMAQKLEKVLERVRVGGWNSPEKLQQLQLHQLPEEDGEDGEVVESVASGETGDDGGNGYSSDDGVLLRSVLRPLVGRYHETTAAQRQKVQTFGEAVERRRRLRKSKEWRWNDESSEDGNVKRDVEQATGSRCNC